MLHLALSRDPVYRLSYDRFTQDPQTYLAEMREDFGLTIPDDYVETVNQTTYHLRRERHRAEEEKFRWIGEGYLLEIRAFPYPAVVF